MIVGRTSLLKSLAATMDDVERGRHASVLLLGDPGMGSTTVLRQAAESARERQWLVVEAGVPEGGSTVALGLVHDLLYSLLSALDRLDGSPEAIDRLVDPSRQQPARLAQTLRDELAAVSQSQPVLLELDDLQWADDDSLGVVSLAAGRLAGTRTMVLGAGRPTTGDDMRLASWEHLAVEPLPPDAATRLLAASLPSSLAGQRVGPDVARRVVDALECCPAAIVDCGRLLSDAQLVGEESLPVELPVSPRLRQAWAAVAERMPPATSRALLALAVMDTTHPELVHELLGRVGCSEADLEPAHDSGLVAEGRHGALSMAGAWQRAAVLSLHRDHEIRQTHRHVAETAVAAGSPPAVVISHLRRACRPGDDECAQELARQADRAHGRNQSEVAATGWTAAARMTRVERRRNDWSVAAARAWLTESTSTAGGDDLLALLNEVVLPPRDSVWREWVRAEVLADRDVRQASSALLLAARNAASHRPALVGWLLWDAATTAWMAGEPGTALDAARRLEAWSRESAESRAGAPQWLATAVLGTALLRSGATGAGVPLLARAMDEARQWSPNEPPPPALLLDVVALDELMLADSPVAEQRAQALLSHLGEESGVTAAGIAAIEAWRAWRAGTWPLALSLAVEAATTARALGAGATERTALSVAVLASEATASAQFEALLERLRQAADHVGDRSAALVADVAEGRRALGTGDAQGAVGLLERVAASPLWGRSTLDPALAGRLDLVEAFARSGDLASARRRADELAPRLEALVPIDPEATARRLRMLAVTASSSHARGLFEAALAAHPSGRCRFEAARTHLAFGAHLLRQGLTCEAQHHCDAARLEFERLGSSLWAAAAGARTSPDPSCLDGLTPQQRRVARLVASGASNREVATALSVSLRTVESHLASVYRTLGLARRSQLAALVSGTTRTGSSTHAAGRPGSGA